MFRILQNASRCLQCFERFAMDAETSTCSNSKYDTPLNLSPGHSQDCLSRVRHRHAPTSFYHLLTALRIFRLFRLKSKFLSKMHKKKKNPTILTIT